MLRQLCHKMVNSTQNASSNSRATISVSGGVQNQVDLVQETDAQTANVSIAGNCNGVRINQQNSARVAGNAVTASITGDGNLFGANQLNVSNASMAVSLNGDRNKVNLTQDTQAGIVDLALAGNDNTLGLRQTGSGSGLANRADITQTGNGNAFDGLQTGASNEMLVKQLSDGNSIALNQTETGNITDITQQ